VRHVVAYSSESFAAWPANNGLWSWDGSEILVGCVSGAYTPQADSHSIRPPYRHVLLRSLDGGESWQAEMPAPFVGDPLEPMALESPLDFNHPGFALRVFGDGYHGSADPRGGFYYSYDRGRSWQGPYRLNGLRTAPELDGLLLTARTDYVISGNSSALLMLSARPDNAFTDRVFCARTRDGLRSLQFAGWVVPPADPFRAVMPATAALTPDRLVSVLRRRAVPGEACWIDAYRSQDGGRSWRFAARVGETGQANGNPPALARLRDGRLCCVYGRRDRGQMVARFSPDEGLRWGEEVVLRADFHDRRPDFGYPRLMQRADGCLVALYYWATRALPVQHIAATIWVPD
jgi:hypothetical protein